MAKAKKAAGNGAPPETGRKMIKLALQGGGAHGAFSWGVIDRLLEDGRIGVQAICGTSAGAMNAAVAAYGIASGGPDRARELLEAFWRKASEAGKKGPLQPSPLDKIMSRGNMDFSPMWNMFNAMTHILSPYQLNPSNKNPLRDIIAEVVDFAELRAHSERVKLFICATNVKTGKIRVFNHDEITPDAVMASACLPYLFQAVEVNGEHFWDGGYCGNPPIFPLIYEGGSTDILIVQINPVNIPEVPTSAHAILDRINTLSFNSSLMREMRAIHFVTKLIDNGFDDGGRLKRMLIHTIEAEETLAGFSVSSKLNPDWDFLIWLRDLGRQKAQEFLDAHFDKIGRESSTDIVAKFM